VDAGDHPPITPVEPATEADLGGGDEWRLYDFVARWFLASVSPDAVLKCARPDCFPDCRETPPPSGPILRARVPCRCHHHR
jgi:hypothetical protein